MDIEKITDGFMLWILVILDVVLFSFSVYLIQEGFIVAVVLTACAVYDAFSILFNKKLTFVSKFYLYILPLGQVF